MEPVTTPATTKLMNSFTTAARQSFRRPRRKGGVAVA
jgi:hypothetical protein